MERLLEGKKDVGLRCVSCTLPGMFLNMTFHQINDPDRILVISTFWNHILKCQDIHVKKWHLHLESIRACQ